MKKAFKKFFLFSALIGATLTLSPSVLGQSDSEQRAAYWKTQGYNFDPTYMTAWAMDQKVQDIQRAAYWKTQGYNFDPTYVTAWAMDQKVQDIKRAAYWKTQGYNFDPTYMTAWAMDAEVASAQQKTVYFNANSSTISSIFVVGQVTAPSTHTPVTPTQIAPSSVYHPANPIYFPPATAENGSYYGEPNQYGVPKTVFVNGYFRSDGTYVRSYYRGSPRW